MECVRVILFSFAVLNVLRTKSFVCQTNLMWQYQTIKPFQNISFRQKQVSKLSDQICRATVSNHSRSWKDAENGSKGYHQSFWCERIYVGNEFRQRGQRSSHLCRVLQRHGQPNPSVQEWPRSLQFVPSSDTISPRFWEAVSFVPSLWSGHKKLGSRNNCKAPQNKVHLRSMPSHWNIRRTKIALKAVLVPASRMPWLST